MQRSKTENNTTTKPLNQNKMKQTAVEWLSEHLCNEMNFDYWKAVEKAKEMEKEQIIEAQENGFTDGCRYTTEFEQTLWHDGEQYYNETYKNKKQ